MSHGARGGTVSAHVAASTRLRIRTRLYTAAAKVNSQPTRYTPRSLTVRNNPTVFNQRSSLRPVCVSVDSRYSRDGG